VPEEHSTTSASLPVTSSVAPELPKEQEALFRGVLTLLEQKNVPFAVSGAFALRQHTGIFRFTKDLDLFLTSKNAGRALQFLEEHGFQTEICDPVWLAKAHRDDFFVDLITGMSNAAIVVEDSWIERAKPAVIYGVETRVLAPEDLIASKLFVTRRERFDGADIAHVIYGTQGKLDWRLVLQTVGEHWEMLLWALVLFRYVYPAQTNYVPQDVWQELLSKFQNAIANPDPNADFRGSLVDENMFAIDIREWGLANLLANLRARRLSQTQTQGQKRCA
jgi:predicted nucleotidyltransferase